jgi:2-polyprenyl-3-methyl-5-hydroxy-6-metoxy-1,4-benzoquinol methylase
MDVESNPNCPLCGATGSTWRGGSHKRCPEPDCGLIWLDPRPRAEDLHQLYSDYFTHRAPASARRRRLGRVAGRALVAVTGVGRERRELRLRLLEGRRPGRLLDIGCGDGRDLLPLRERGWEVEGQEIDPVAAERARSVHGIEVHLGRSEVLGGRRYHAVTMTHVLEHDPDPVALLAAAFSLLEPGGVLFALTPNPDGLGSRVFGDSWLGLDPPRHLYLLSPTALRRAAAEARLPGVKVWASAANADRYARGSLALRRAARGRAVTTPPVTDALLASGFQLLELAAHRARRTSGEECVLQVTA